MFATRTEQTTQTTGTGTIDLLPALTGRLNFSSTIGSGNACYYILQTQDESQWEEGIGTVTAGTPDQLTRTTVICSSNANNLVNFPAGTKTVFIGVTSDSLRFGAVGQLPTAGGTASAITVAYAPAVRHLRAGMRFSFLASAAGAGAATTVTFNGLTAVALVLADGTTSPGTKDIVSGSVVHTVFDGTKLRLSFQETLGVLERAYPVGSLYFNASSEVNPGTLLGFGTWSAFAAGRLLLGVGTGTDGNSDTLTVTGGATGGEYNHVLSSTEMPSHTHTDSGHTHNFAHEVPTNVSGSSTPWGGSKGIITGTNTGYAALQNTGGGLKHNNTQPYIGVYIWQRTA